VNVTGTFLTGKHALPPLRAAWVHCGNAAESTLVATVPPTLVSPSL
jgi:hypothetical protein